MSSPKEEDPTMAPKPKVGYKDSPKEKDSRPPMEGEKKLPPWLKKGGKKK